jgi:Bifunctional DNA primase/polymerase, N-terminal/Primase C terminal 2 (PriCT-2)
MDAISSPNAAKALSNLEAALAYAEIGLAVFPCEPADKSPVGPLVPLDLGPNRKPIKGTGGLKKATRDPVLIREWWTMRPDAMIGAATGAASGFWAVDPDVPKQVKKGKLGELSPDGRKAWADLKAEHGDHDPTIEVTTPSGGQHIYFGYDPERPVGNREGALSGRGINVRGDGGYVILPPSRRLDGKAYAANAPFDPAALAEAPDWLYEAIGGRRKAERKARSGAKPNGAASPFTSNGFHYNAANEAELQEALACIPANDRDTWLHIGAALHSLPDDWGDRRREIWDEWSIKSHKFDADDQNKTWESFRRDHPDPITIRTVNSEARKYGWKPDLAAGVTLDDFVAYMPCHSYIFKPTTEPWPASSVDARIPPIPLVDQHGAPKLDSKGEQKKTKASTWLDQNAPVEQMTWAPGLPQLIPDRLVSDGGFVERPGVTTFNLYRPPVIVPGDPSKAGPWLEHLHKIYPDTANEQIKWFAHRVQRPGEKINHGLFLGSDAFGVGKDTLLEPVKRAVGPWNFADITPQQIMGRFNGFVKSVILRINEARDLGDFDRYALYDHLKIYAAAPPDVLRCDEKNLREHAVLNVTAPIITSNHRDGFYLPPDDRRYFVDWTEARQTDFEQDYWNKIWYYYEHGGFGHVAAYLLSVDLSDFDPKAPPRKTAAFWIVADAGRSPEDAELADVIDALGRPDALTIGEITKECGDGSFLEWLEDRKNRRAIPHRLKRCGYVPVRNDDADDGLWSINGKRQVIYVAQALPVQMRFIAAHALQAKPAARRSSR